MTDWKPKKELDRQYIMYKTTPFVYYITMDAGTEIKRTGYYMDNWEPGIYRCIICGDTMFKSEDKIKNRDFTSFHSKTENVMIVDEERPKEHDFQVSRFSEGKERIVKDMRRAAKCMNCGSHLGLVFNDGPKRYGGKRYAINSVSV